MVELSTLIEVIECCQPVLNKDELKDCQKSVRQVATLEDAHADALAFLSDAKYLSALDVTQAGVILISHKFADKIPTSVGAVVVLVRDAYLAYASVSGLFAYQHGTGIHPTVVIAKSAKLGKNVTIGAYSVIGEYAEIGDDVSIGTHVVVGDYAIIGRHSYLDSHVYIAHHCLVGEYGRIHTHASIGSEGFGFAPNMADKRLAWQRITQLGRVVVGNRVRIGAQTCVDRGAVGDTIIGDDVIIDNLVQIAHNVYIGSGTAIAANTGIAGSTHIGCRCMIGGAVGISGHLEICDDVTITAMSMVISSIKESGVYSSGIPTMPSHDWRRAAVKFRQSGKK